VLASDSVSGTRTTADNPGAFQRRHGPDLVTTGRRVVAELRARQPRAALVHAISALANGAGRLGHAWLASRYECPCCGAREPFFVHRAGGNEVIWNSMCPACDARSRHRGLVALLPELLDEMRPARVLHFAPEAVLRHVFARPGLVYETCDFLLADVTHPGVDIQRMPFPDGSYDFLLCNHVLEHVEDDRAAMRELARILRPGGVAVLTVPGDFRRHETLRFDGHRRNGHYRDYGMVILEPLGEAFGQVETVDLHRFDVAPSGRSRAIRRHEVAFVCRTSVNPR
jgi:SAM-dependent methyltransferase